MKNIRIDSRSRQIRKLDVRAGQWAARDVSPNPHDRIIQGRALQKQTINSDQSAGRHRNAAVKRRVVESAFAQDKGPLNAVNSTDTVIGPTAAILRNVVNAAVQSEQ